MIRAAGFGAQLNEFFKLEGCVRVRVCGNRHQQQEITNGRDAHVIAVRRMHLVAQGVSAGFERLTAKIIRRLREGDHANQRPFRQHRVNRARRIGLACRDGSAKPDFASDAAIGKRDAIAVRRERFAHGFGRALISKCADAFNLAAVSGQHGERNE